MCTETDTMCTDTDTNFKRTDIHLKSVQTFVLGEEDAELVTHMQNWKETNQ